MRVLDLGCGYGLVSAFLASQYNKGVFSSITRLSLDACDSSPLAVDITKNNLQEYAGQHIDYTITNSDILSDLYFADKQYDVIITNPPFSAGKKVVKQFLTQAYEHLASA